MKNIMYDKPKITRTNFSPHTLSPAEDIITDITGDIVEEIGGLKEDDEEEVARIVSEQLREYMYQEKHYNLVKQDAVKEIESGRRIKLD